MPGQVSFGFIDHSREKSSTALFLPTITAANFDAVTGNTIAENVGALRLAIAAITLCNFTNTRVVAVEYPENDVTPADPYAQRETGLRVFMTDTVTGEKSHMTIPGPNLTLLAQVGTDEVDPSAATWLTLVGAIEAEARSKDGNVLEVTSGRIVGRNS